MRGVVGVPVGAVPFLSAASGALSIVDAAAAVTVTADATPHTKGSWIELIAATTEDTDWLTLGISGTMAINGTDTRGLLDIAIGAAAAEVAIITEIPAGFISNGMHITLPVFIPKGARVSARLQAVTTVDTVAIAATVSSTGALRRSPPRLVTLNANVAASTSTTMMTVSNTWTEVTAATAEPFQGLAAVMCGGVGPTWTFDGSEILSVGVGAAGAELLHARSPVITWGSTESIGTQATHSFPPQIYALSSRPVPAGSRIATKYTTGRAHKGAIVFGVPYS